MNLFDLFEGLQTEDRCIKMLEDLRWEGVPQCPYPKCKSKRSSKGVKRYYTCLECGNGYSVTVGTMFHNTNLPIKKWIAALVLFVNSKQGLSAKALERHIGVNYRTAWSMLSKIRNSIIPDTVEEGYFQYLLVMDEVDLTAKPRKLAQRDVIREGNVELGITPVYGTWRTKKKKPRHVAGIYDRAFKKLVLRNLPPNYRNQRKSQKQIYAILHELNPDDNATVYTDEGSWYNFLNYGKYKHPTVNHSLHYVDGQNHTNHLEGAFQKLRSLFRVYVSISDKYFDDYLKEFAFHFNHRHSDSAFFQIMYNALGMQHPWGPVWKKS